MTWFKVDDSFYDHPKAFDATDAAIALWTRAGCWSARNLTDGFVPDGMLGRLSASAKAAAEELHARGLWKRTRGGYRFHDWTDYQPTRERVEHERKLTAQRQAAFRDRKRKPQVNPNGVTGVVTRDVTRDKRVSHASPTRPDPPPTGVRVGSAPAFGARRTDQCPRHIGQPALNCAPCRSERIAAKDPT